MLIGATTENPSFEVVSPLLSRARVFALKSLTDEQVERIIHMAMADSERGISNLKPQLEGDAMAMLVNLASGESSLHTNGLRE